MDYFNKKRRFKALVRDFRGKMEAVEGTELSRKKNVVFVLDVPITQAMKDLMPKGIANFLNSNEVQQDIKLTRLLTSMTKTVSCRFFSMEKPEKPIAECGFDDAGEPVTLSVEKFFFVDAIEMMRVVMRTQYREDLWAMGGNYLGDGELAVESKPHQGDIFEEAGSQTEDDSNEDPGEKLSKKKKKTVPEVEPEPAQA